MQVPGGPDCSGAVNPEPLYCCGRKAVRSEGKRHGFQQVRREGSSWKNKVEQGASVCYLLNFEPGVCLNDLKN